MAKKMALGSRPKTEFQKKLVGIVTVTTGNNMAKLVMEDEGKLFANGTDELRVKLEDLPHTPKLAPNDKEGKRYRVRMSPDGMDVESLGPVNGTFKGILVDMSRPGKDEPPAPYEKVWNEGKDNENRHLEFWVAYKVTQGHFKGVQLPSYKLHYKFEEDPDNEGFARFAGNFENKKATRLFQLRDWGMLYDMWSDPIQWPEDGNILPELFERAMQNDVEVDIVVKDGYPVDVTRPDAYENYDDEQDVDDAFPVQKAKVAKNTSTKKPLPAKAPAKPAKKVAAKVAKSRRNSY